MAPQTIRKVKDGVGIYEVIKDKKDKHIITTFLVFIDLNSEYYDIMTLVCRYLILAS